MKEPLLYKLGRNSYVDFKRQAKNFERDLNLPKFLEIFRHARWSSASPVAKVCRVKLKNIQHL